MRRRSRWSEPVRDNKRVVVIVIITDRTRKYHLESVFTCNRICNQVRIMGRMKTSRIYIYLYKYKEKETDIYIIMYV